MIRLWQPLVVNRRGGNGGGGGGEVVVKEEKYPFIMNNSYVSSFVATSYFLPFNLDNNKMVASLAGYSGGLSIISLTTNSYTSKSKANSDVPQLALIAIYKDDSFIVYYYNGKLNYVPVTSNYTFGTPISVNITDFGYGTNIHKVIILSPTRFAFFEYNNTRIGIFKLENGSLVEDKYIDATNLNLTNTRIFSFKENLGLIIGYSGNIVGIRIIDPDTEATIYEDLRIDGTNKPYEAQEKDNLLFLECANNTTPYITEPIMVYEYSNGTISKKNMTIKDFEVKEYSGGNFWVHKQSESVYILTTSISQRTEMQIMICDIEKGTIETSFCAGAINNPTTSCIVTLNDGTSRVFQSNNVGSYPSYTRICYGFLYSEKTATVLEYNTNTYNLTALGE